MTQATLIESYLGRAVTLQELSSLSELETIGLSQAVVLLWLGNRSWKLSQLEKAITELAANNILNVTVAGERSDESFAALLKVLAALPASKHIMTGVIDNSEVKDPLEDSSIVKHAIESFLFNSWPDTERFDDWKESRILVVGRPGLASVIHSLVLEISNRKP